METTGPHDPLGDFDREIMRFLAGAGIDTTRVRLDVPKRAEHGERAVNIFALARERQTNPNQLAADVAASFMQDQYRFISAVEPAGGFVNFRLDWSAFVPHVLHEIAVAGAEFGRASEPPAFVIVEHTSVNPNKEWHIGHVRNAVLGDTVARVLRLAGHTVEVQNYIDDTGLQAATAVYALRTFPEPQKQSEKYDHFVGRLYVKISREVDPALVKSLDARAAELRASGNPNAEQELHGLGVRLHNIRTRLQPGTVRTMHELEQGIHHEVIDQLLQAQLETAFRLGIYYDLLNWESHLVQSKLLDTAMELVQRSPHAGHPTEGRYAGAFVIYTGATTAEGGEKAEVLVRSNGIPTYVGKDIAYHMWKLRLVPDPLYYTTFLEQPDGTLLWSTSLAGAERPAAVPDRVINIIGVNQSQPQESVKLGITAAGFEREAEKLFHLAYGLVKTSEGMLSGRKGTAAAGDDVIQGAVDAALQRITEKQSVDLDADEMQTIAEAVGVGAVRYFMVQYNPMREIVFDIDDVVSFDGNTGLYIQYALVRMFSILRKAADAGITDNAIDTADLSLLQHEQERRLAFHLARWPETVSTVSRTLAVNLIAEWVYELAGIFSAFYRDCGVMNAEPGLRESRLLLVRTVRGALINACAVLGLPIIERL
jgi:arginyl-tRNA synthetase